MKIYSIKVVTFFILLTFLTLSLYTSAQDIPVGVLKVQSDIERARIYLDDKLVGITNTTVSNIEVGNHSLKIEHKDHITLEKSITIMEGDTLILQEKLEPGYLVSIKSVPDKAQVFVNKLFVGTSPINVKLQKESNLIEVSKEYYYTNSETFIPKRQDEKLTIQLDSKSFENVVSTYPKNTSILLGSDIIKDGETITLIGGYHELTIGKKGFKAFNGSFIVEDLDETQLHHFLIEPEKYRKKNIALLYSLILPGMGQRYLKRGGFEPALGIAGYGLLLGSLSKHNNAVKSYDLYLAETDFDTRESLNNQWQSEKQQSDIMLYSAGVVWLGGIIWTLFTDDEASHYKKIRTKINFDNYTNSGTVSLSIPLNK